MTDFSTSQSVANLTDFVLSDDGKLAYLTSSDGKLLRWDVQAKTFLAPITLGGNLTALDLSPDGSYLLVGRAEVVNGNQPDAWWKFVGHTLLDRVRTDTFAVTQMDLTVTGAELGVSNIALVGANMAMVDDAYSGSGWVPLHYFSALLNGAVPDTTVPDAASVRQDTYLIPSADNRYVFIQEANISNAPMRLFDTQTNTQIAYNDIYALGSYGFNRGMGDINVNTRLVVNLIDSRIYVLDFQLKLVKDLSSLFSKEFIVGAQFSADGEHLFLWGDGTRQLHVFETRGWTEVSSVALQSPISGVGNRYVGGMDISLDGRTLFLDNSVGFEIVDLESRLSINLSGGAGAETLYGSVGADGLSGGAGDDTLNGGSGDDQLAGGPGNDLLAGGAGVDMANYVNATGGVTVSLLLTTAQAVGGGEGSDTLSGIENLAGSAFNDTLTGDAGANLLMGLAGDDTLDGGAGADRLYGGTGNDTFKVDTQGDLVFEFAAEGTDTVVTTAGYYLYDNIENLMLASGAGDIFGVGNGLDNRIDANEGNNLLLGGDGKDLIFGYMGDDRLFGQAGDDTLLGGGGNDQLVGGAGNDIINGDDGADSLYGEDGNDFLHGNAGVDILVGGAGNDNLDGQNGGAGEQDLMDGGAGDDTYIVDAANDLTFEAVGGGTDTVIAIIQGGGYYLYANVENLVLGGGTAFGVGNELDNVISGNDGANWLLGGAGNDTLDGGGGNDVLFGQAGADTFGFHRIGGKFPTRIGADAVADFTPGVDKVNLAGIYSTFAEVQSHMVQYAGDTAIDLGQGDLVVFQHVGMSAFTAGDFLFT